MEIFYPFIRCLTVKMAITHHICSALFLICFVRGCWSYTPTVVQYGEFELLDYTNHTEPRCRAERENNNWFITPKMREYICEERAQSGFHVEMHTNPSCFEDEGNGLTTLNPCVVICPMHRLRANAGKDDCRVRGHKLLLTKVQCGPRHECNTHGCCVEVDEPTTTPEPTTPEPTTPEPTTPEPTTPEPTTPEPTTPEPTTPEPTTDITWTEKNPGQPSFDVHEALHEGHELMQRIQQLALDKFSRESFTCTTEGQFSSRRQTFLSKKYFDCRWVTTLYKCPTGKTFNAQKKKCMKVIPKVPEHIPSHDEVLKLEEWAPHIRCKKEGVFRSPFDCQYFYFCSPKHEHSLGEKFNVEITKCRYNLVFDEAMNRCEEPQLAEPCNNVHKLLHV